VTNPDNQSYTYTNGFTVIGTEEEGDDDSGCSCMVATRGQNSSNIIGLSGLLLLFSFILFKVRN